MTQLGEANHLSWLADIEQVCKLKDCWDVVVAPIPLSDLALIAGLESVPTKTALTMTLADPEATVEDKRGARAVLGALDWRRKDQVAQAILKLNLEDGKHDALKECASAHDVYSQVLDSFTSRGLSGKIELRRRLCSLRKAAKESMTSFINRASMLKIEMNRMGIHTPEEELVAALLAGLPETYAGTVELIENHGPEDLPGVTRRLLAAELKRRRMERDEDEAAALAAAAVPAAPRAQLPARGVPQGAPATHLYPPAMPHGYGQGMPHMAMAQYYPMAPHPYHMGGQFMMPQIDNHGGPAGRPPRQCWSCGMPGHLQRQCPNHALAPAHGHGAHLPGGNFPPPPFAAAAGDGLPAGPPAPWGLPPPGPPAGGTAPGPRPAEGAPLRPRREDTAGPRRPGGQPPNRLALMAMVAGEADAMGSHDWIIDSGATHHMTSTTADLVNVRDIEPLRIKMAGGQVVSATRAGDAATTLVGEDGLLPVTLHSVVVVPGLAVNLFSVRVMTRKGFGAHFHVGGLDIINDAGVVFRGLERGNVFVLPTLRASSPIPTTVGTAALAAGAPLWHSRLAHISADAVLHTTKAVDGMSMAGEHPRKQLAAMCDSCVAGKQTRQPFPMSRSTTTAPLELVHTDVCGPMPVPSLGNAKYFVTVVDDKSDYKEAITIASKSDAGPAVRDTIARWEAQTGQRMKRWRSDRGGEYMNKAMAKWTAERGAVHETTAPYTPEQNGKAERANRSILEKVGAIMTAAGCAKWLWAEAVSTVAHVLNRVPRAGTMATPYELWCGMRPSVAHLRVFGCRAVVLTPAKLRRKLAPRGVAGTFIGYEAGCKAYRVLVGKAIKISRNVVFDESRMGCEPDITAIADDWDDDELQPLLDEDDWPAPVAPHSAESTLDTAANPAREELDEHPQTPTPNDPLAGLHEAATLAATLPQAPPLNAGPARRLPATADRMAAPRGQQGAPRRSMRDRFMPARLGEWATHRDAGGGAATRSPETDHPGSATDGAEAVVDQALGAYARGAATIPVGDPPTLASDHPKGPTQAAYEGPDADKMTLSKARKQADWPLFDAAVAKEMDALWDNGTFALASLPRGASVLPFQILCERKRGPNGEVVRHKGRGVACGNFQVPGRDFGEVWAPVVRRATLLTTISHAAAEGMLMYQPDVETAFLNGPVHEELYVREPKGYERGRADQVLRLYKAVYGLKQAARQWFLELIKLMHRMGMQQSSADPCLFFKDVAGTRIYLLIYVDDLLLVAATQHQLDQMKDEIMRAFKSRDIGTPTYFLGLHLDRDVRRGTLVVSQRQYVHRLVERHGLADAHPVLLPMTPGAGPHQEGTLLEPSGILRYQALIGGLLYLATCTRPDVSYSVGKLARHSSAPTEQHEAAALRVLRYLKGTAQWGLRFGGRQPLLGYCDADYAGDVDSRRSTSGYSFLLNGAAVSWASKLQPTVAMSTTEAEYIAAAVAAREGIWLKQLLLDVGQTEGPVQLRSDNQSAIHLMHNPGGTARSKHIDIAHHFVRDRVSRGDLAVRYVGTGEMVADVLTKALPGALLARCREGLGMAEVQEEGPQGDAGGDEAADKDDEDDDRLVGSVGGGGPDGGGHSTWPGARRHEGSN